MVDTNKAYKPSQRWILLVGLGSLVWARLKTVCLTTILGLENNKCFPTLKSLPAVARLPVISQSRLLSTRQRAKTIQALQVSNEVVQIFSVSLVNIQKALTLKEYRDPTQYAPNWLMPVINVFNRQDAKTLPPHRKGIDHEINFVEGKTNDDVPAMPLYQMSKDQLLVLRKTLTELLDNGFIRVSNSPAAAPVIFVKKPGGGLRFCVDYRRLNKISRKDSYPIPRIDETLRTIAVAKYISKVDVISAFHRIRVKDGDEWKTAFNTRFGLYEWLVTPFRLTGALATFQ